MNSLLIETSFGEFDREDVSGMKSSAIFESVKKRQLFLFGWKSPVVNSNNLSKPFVFLFCGTREIDS